MSLKLSQKHRLLSLEGGSLFSEFIPQSFKAEEGLSELYYVEVHGYCTNSKQNPEDWLGKAATLKINDKNQQRYFHGHVAEVWNEGMTERRLRRCSFILRPQIWFLTHIEDCRLYENKTLPEIIKSIITEHDLKGVSLTNLKDNYPTKEYTVQYNESVLHFLLRTLETSGIHYYFKHKVDSHEWCLVDNINFLPMLPGKYIYQNEQSEGIYLYDWRSSTTVTSTSLQLSDYSYQTAAINLKTTQLTQSPILIEGLNIPLALSVYQYAVQGGYTTHALGQKKTSLELNKRQKQREKYSGKSNVLNFSGGYQFHLYHPDLPHQSGHYRLLKIKHEGHDYSHMSNNIKIENKATSNEPVCGYHNEFECVPSLSNILSSPSYSKPKAKGHHTAIVIGSKPNAIHTDKLGRIQVRLVWDNRNDRDIQTWVRVLQRQSGDQWGVHALPRVGQEVLIAYQEDDIDRPVCLGAVYNNEHQPPFPLPEQQHISGIRTKSLRESDSSAGHELSFSDMPQSENIKFIAYNELNEHVQKDAILTIHGQYKEHVHYNKIVNVTDESYTASAEQLVLMSEGAKITVKPNQIIFEASSIDLGKTANAKQKK